MQRVKTYLRPQQIEMLRELAKRRGVSMAALVRQALDCFLAEEDSLWNIISTFDSDLGNLAEKHDEYPNYRQSFFCDRTRLSAWVCRQCGLSLPPPFQG